MAVKSRNDYYLDYSILDRENGDIFKQAVNNLSKILGSANEEYKDSVFRMLVNDRSVALEIYNAMNDSDYHNAEDIIVTTLRNAVYMGVKNDASFIIVSQLMIYEQQSTVNPNMPLRDLEYVACLMAALTYDANIYSRRLIRLPEPKFVVFYNGEEKVPERYEMKLSDAYEHHTDDPSLELKIDVVNINPGYNEELLAKCPTLCQYMEFVSTVRSYRNKYNFDDAMDLAIEHCIRNNILADFLKKNKAEVLRMNIFEYDQEKHIRMEKEESYEEGVQDGEERGEKRGIQIGEERGIQIGEKRGEQSLLTKQVSSKLKKGYTLEQTAEALEYPIKELEPIYNMVREAESGYNVSLTSTKNKTEK